MQWIFSIHKDNEPSVATMTYNWDKDEWHISIDKTRDPKDMPAILMIASQQGRYELEDKVCRWFIRDRVVPANRQNIGQILRKIGAPYYNEAFIFQYAPRSCMDDFLIDFQQEIK